MFDKTKIIIAFGSNYEPLINVAYAKTQLSSLFESIVFSSEIWTEPIKIKSDKFINCVAVAETAENLESTLHSLKEVEDLCGNTTTNRLKGKVIMDVDLLKYGNTKLHENDWQRPYIIQLLNELNIKIE
jgi:2-amino-4-hydroxy-6-hydroxymethyldihydropteridine diphosphokinase